MKVTPTKTFRTIPLSFTERVERFVKQKLKKKKKPRKPYWTAYVYWDNCDWPLEPEFSEHDSYWGDSSLISFGHYETCFLKYEIDNAGMSRELLEQLSKYPSGYYEVHFTTHTEYESNDGWFEYSYEVMGEILTMKKSRWAKWLEFKRNYVDPAHYNVDSVFRKTWSIEYDYGGAGIGTPEFWLPQALYYRYVNKLKHAGWGEQYKTIRLRR